MVAQWYYSRGGETHGPVSGDELRKLVAARELAPADLVWRDGMLEWEPAESLGLFGNRSPPTAPPPAPPPVAARPLAEGPARRHNPDPPKKWQSTDRNRVARTHRGSGNARKVIWIGFGIAATLLCGVWIGYAVRPPADLTSRSEFAAPEAKTEQPLLSSRSEPLAAEPESALTSPTLRNESIADVPTVTEPSDGASPPRDDRPSSKPAPRANSTQDRAAPGSFYQEIDIQRKPTFTVQGMTMPQQVHYRILSRFDVGPRQSDGTQKAVQIVEDTKLEEADDLSRATFVKSLENLKRQQFTYTLNHNNEVIEFKGHKKSVASLPVDMLAGKGFMVTSVIDEDGWKELAQLMFFLPDDGVNQGQLYRRQMSHDWEPLGHWTGMTQFVGKGRDGPFERIEYAHELVYEPPAKKSGMLPFQITDADFAPVIAAGTILFDVERRRVSQVEEQFHVTGSVATEVLGQTVTIQLREEQLLTLRVSDQRPPD